jgi:hypothetical protein
MACMGDTSLEKDDSGVWILWREMCIIMAVCLFVMLLILEICWVLICNFV